MSNIINGKYIPEVEFSGSVQMPEWVKGADGYTPVKGVDYWTEEEINAAYDYLVEKVATIDWDDINIDMSDVINALKEELAAVAFTNSYNDLTDKPTIPSTVGLATEEYVNSKVANIDLTNYVLASALSKVAKSGKYSDLTGVPTKLSQFQNDSGFLTQHQSLLDYAKKTYVQSEIAKIPQPDLSQYAKKSEIPDVSKFLTGIPEEYVTESELAAKGFATLDDIPTLPNFDNFATKQYVTEEIAKAATGGGVDLSGYVTEEQLEQDLEIFAGRDEFADVAFSGDYRDLSNTPKRLGDFYNDLVYVEVETDPTVPAWAKEKTKPSYTYDEVGADPDGSAAEALNSAKAYADELAKNYEAAGTAQRLIDALVGTAPEAYDTIQELAEALNKDKEGSVINSLMQLIGTKADSTAIPTDNKNLENGAGFITAEALTGLQTAEDVQAAITSALGNIGIAEEGEY